MKKEKIWTLVSYGLITIAVIFLVISVSNSIMEKELQRIRHYDSVSVSFEEMRREIKQTQQSFSKINKVIQNQERIIITLDLIQDQFNYVCNTGDLDNFEQTIKGFTFNFRNWNMSSGDCPAMNQKERLGFLWRELKFEINHIGKGNIEMDKYYRNYPYCQDDAFIGEEE